MAFHVVIPARYASTRLPGKPLLDIGGVPMIQRVVARACASSADEVLVATDDARIGEAVADTRHPERSIAVMTDPALPSGTDRVAAVAAARGWSDDTVVVNVQGDEPFLPPGLIDQVAGLLGRDATAAVATLASPIESLAEFIDPNVVKVVKAHDGTALYFSRAPIPWLRTGGGAAQPALPQQPPALRHVGLYAYRAAFLRGFPSLPPSPVEATEALEQLRVLWHGQRIAVHVSEQAPGTGVDTPEDLERVRALFRAGTA